MSAFKGLKRVFQSHRKGQRQKNEAKRDPNFEALELVSKIEEIIYNWGDNCEYEPLKSPTQFRVVRLHCRDDSRVQALQARMEEKRKLLGEDLDFPVRERLLDVHARFRSAVVCSLETFDLDSPDCPLFEAVSYRWDENDDGSHVIVGKGALTFSIKTGSNLADILGRIQRSGGDECWLWADAVCIDQNSAAEKGHQVRLMGRIYSEASKVLVSLPVPRTFHSLGQMYLADAIRQLLRGDHDFSHFYETGDLQYEDPKSRSWDNVDAGSLLQAVFSSEHWSRKWIIQETIMARTVVIRMGDDEMAMEELENLIFNMAEVYARKPANSGRPAVVASWPIVRLASHRRNKRLGQPCPRMLADLLVLYRISKCSVAMDHVYALYSLIGDHRDHLGIDYEQTPQAWLQNIFEFLARREPSSHSIMVNIMASLQQAGLKIDTSYHRSKQHDTSACQLTATIWDRGFLVVREECSISTHLRRSYPSLHPGFQWYLERSDSGWRISERRHQRSRDPISSRGYFEIPDHSLCGLAAARIEDGDRVWQFINASFGYIVRNEPQRERVRIVGRCYLFRLPVTTIPADNIPKDIVSRDVLAFNPSSQGGDALERHDLRLDSLDLWTLVDDARIEASENISKSVEHRRELVHSKDYKLLARDQAGHGIRFYRTLMRWPKGRLLSAARVSRFSISQQSIHGSGMMN